MFDCSYREDRENVQWFPDGDEGDVSWEGRKLIRN